MDVSLERMSANEEIGDIQLYLRYQRFTKLINDTIQQHIEEVFSKIIK